MSGNRAVNLDQILHNWELSYKKGFLTFWILMVIYRQETYPYELNDALREISEGTVSADTNSIYRALRRFEKLGIVESSARSSPSGPDRRYYRLTEFGQTLLARFIERNLQVFHSPALVQCMKSITDGK